MPVNQMIPNIEYVDADPSQRRGTRKKVWDRSTNSWQDVTIWTVPATRELCDWLQKEYPNFDGWHYAWSDTKVVIQERVYVFYCLKFGLR